MLDLNYPQKYGYRNPELYCNIVKSTTLKFSPVTLFQLNFF